MMRDAKRVETHFGTISVRGSNGNKLMLHEISGSPKFFGLISDVRLELATGEIVEQIGRDTFIVAATGEKLTRVKD
jgi:hypothetical protein